MTLVHLRIAVLDVIENTDTVIAEEREESGGDHNISLFFSLKEKRNDNQDVQPSHLQCKYLKWNSWYKGTYLIGLQSEIVNEKNS